VDSNVRHQVLVVEDDAELREAICGVLDSEGCPSASAENGDSALDLLAHGMEPCLILLDYRMPGISAHEFLDRLRSLPGGGRVPVVVLTGSSDALPMLEADRILRKPFPPERLVRIVDEHCGCSVGKVESGGGTHAHYPPWKTGTRG
jgi:CheY-like chemotaxis protein